MRKIFLAVAVFLLISTASATTISDEDVVIDLQNDKITADIHVELLTSSAFSYTTTGNVETVNATIDGEKVECQTSNLALGSEIECPTEKKRNFTVKLEYQSQGLISKQDGVNVFRYRHPVYRPTESYSLEVMLPAGTALLDRENASQQVISPQNYETSSNGRRISVNWDLNPELGETLSFFTLYQDFSTEEQSSINYTVIAQILGVLFILTLGTAVFLRHKRSDLSETYEDMSDDQKEVLKLIEDNEGEYLQKDLVKELDYSKAKISGVVSDLVDEGVLKKTKEGRSNKLSISRKFRY